MKFYRSKMTIINKDSNLECIFHEHTMEIILKTQELQYKDSEWSLIKLIRFHTTTLFAFNERGNR